MPARDLILEGLAPSCAKSITLRGLGGACMDVLSRHMSETLGIGDSLSFGTTRSRTRTIAISVPISDAVKRTAAITRRLAASISSLDAVAKTVLKRAGSALHLGDLVARSDGLTGAVAESVSVLDAAVRKRITHAILGGAASIAGAVSRTKASSTRPHESWPMTESITRRLDAIRRAADHPVLTDTISYHTMHDLVVRMAETVMAPADIIHRSRHLAKAFHSILGMNDAAVRSRHQERLQAAVLAASDSISARFRVGIAASVGLADSLSKRVRKGIAGTVPVADDVVHSRITAAVITGAVAAADSIVRNIGRGIAFSEGTGDFIIRRTTRSTAAVLLLADSATHSRIIRTAISATLVISESVKRRMTKSFTENYTLYDIIGKNHVFARAASVVMSIGDNLAETWQAHRNLAASISLGDVLSRTAAFSRGFGSILASADSVIRQRLIGRNVSDPLTESLTARLRIYGSRSITPTDCHVEGDSLEGGKVFLCSNGNVRSYDYAADRLENQRNLGNLTGAATGMTLAGTVMFTVDWVDGRVYGYDYDGSTNSISGQRELATVTDFPTGLDFAHGRLFMVNRTSRQINTWEWDGTSLYNRQNIGQTVDGWDVEGISVAGDTLYVCEAGTARSIRAITYNPGDNSISGAWRNLSTNVYSNPRGIKAVPPHVFTAHSSGRRTYRYVYGSGWGDHVLRIAQGQARAILESVQVAGAITQYVRKGIADSLLWADSAIRRFATRISVAGAAGAISDSAAKLLGKAAGDVVGIGDLITRTGAFNRAVSAAAGIADSAIRMAGTLRNIAYSVTPGEVISRTELTGTLSILPPRAIHVENGTMFLLTGTGIYRYVIDGDGITGETLVGTVSGGMNGMVLDNGTFYLARGRDIYSVAYDGTTLGPEVLETSLTGSPGGMHGLAISGRRLFTIERRTDSIYSWDLDDIQASPVNVGPAVNLARFTGIAVGAGRIYVTSEQPSQLWAIRFDPGSMSMAGEWYRITGPPLKTNPRGLSHDGAYLYSVHSDISVYRYAHAAGTVADLITGSTVGYGRLVAEILPVAGAIVRRLAAMRGISDGLTFIEAIKRIVQTSRVFHTVRHVDTFFRSGASGTSRTRSRASAESGAKRTGSFLSRTRKKSKNTSGYKTK